MLNSKIVDTDERKIEELVNRGVEDVFVKETLLGKLRSGKQLRVKLGFDPTGPNIHIGRAVVLRKLKAFQELGHKIVFLVGDYTAQIGDPSDKLEKRPMLTAAKIKESLKNYKKQVGKIIDLKKAEFHFNSKWLSKLSFQEICNLTEIFSVHQMLSRRNFAERFEKKQEISIREFMYPLMQGYDSVMLKSDIEIGGFDQLFNLKAGRIIQKFYGQAEQDVLTCQMLEGTDGRKMSTSWNNVINIVDEPNDMYGKIMALRDELIPKYFLLATDVPESYVKEIEDKLKGGQNPKELKMELAYEIVRLYHGNVLADKAQSRFVSVFSKKNIPDDVRVVEVATGAILRDLLVDTGYVASRAEWGRLVQAGAVQNMNTGAKIENHLVDAETHTVYRVGKKHFVKVVVK